MTQGDLVRQLYLQCSYLLVPIHMSYHCIGFLLDGCQLLYRNLYQLVDLFRQ